MQLTCRRLSRLAAIALGGMALSPFAVQAIEPEHQKLIEQLMEVNRSKEMYNQSVVGSFEASIANTAKSLPPDQQEKFGKAMERVKALLIERLGWEVLKEEVMALYAERFTAAELEAVLPLLQKPEMQGFLAKQGQLTSDLSKLTSEKSQALQKEIMAIVQEEMMK